MDNSGNLANYSSNGDSGDGSSEDLFNEDEIEANNVGA